MPSTPHQIKGTLYVKTTPLASIPITFTNSRTGDTLTETTDSYGHYVINTGNFTNGYENNDSILAEPDFGYSVDDLDLYVSIDEGKTWSIVNDDTLITMRYYKGRTKIDTTHYPRSRTDLTIRV